MTMSAVNLTAELHKWKINGGKIPLKSWFMQWTVPNIYSPGRKVWAIKQTRQPLEQVGEIAHVHDQVSKSFSDFLFPETEISTEGESAQTTYVFTSREVHHTSFTTLHAQRGTKSELSLKKINKGQQPHNSTNPKTGCKLEWFPKFRLQQLNWYNDIHNL